ALGGCPPGLAFEGPWNDRACFGPFLPLYSPGIPYSVGSFNHPNSLEENTARLVLDLLELHPAQQRPLLVLPCAPQPARRFLRAMVRTAPVESQRFVVASGDAIDFNTLYRDRQLAWPIQDLPLTLVCFCQRNPVDPSAFQPDLPGSETIPPDPSGHTSTGTQDLLLYQDIVEALVEAAYRPEGLQADADQLREALRGIRLKAGGHFDPEGELRSGSGGFVVCLRPTRQGGRVLPQARLQVWELTHPEGARH